MTTPAKPKTQRRKDLDRRRSRRKQFANTKTPQPQSQAPKKHKLRNAARILVDANNEIQPTEIPF